MCQHPSCRSCSVVPIFRYRDADAAQWSGFIFLKPWEVFSNVSHVPDGVARSRACRTLAIAVSHLGLSVSHTLSWCRTFRRECHTFRLGVVLEGVHILLALAWRGSQ